jgi:anti-sigma regulatory factor (Ser/Thr protein kinase)
VTPGGGVASTSPAPQVTIDLQLDNNPDAASLARRALDGLTDEVPERRVRDAQLLVSELVTNAVRHAGLRPGDRIRVRVDLDDRAVHVEVHDPGSGFEPRPPQPDPTRMSGWGLYLVDELADRWGVDDGGGGTRIWFELERAG